MMNKQTYIEEGYGFHFGQNFGGYRHGHNEPVAYIPTEGWQAITQRAQVINDCYDKTRTKDALYGCYVSN